VAEDVDVTVGCDDGNKSTENPIESLSRDLVNDMKERSRKAKENLLSIFGLENKS
jgi:hypothetical protein